MEYGVQTGRDHFISSRRMGKGASRAHHGIGYAARWARAALPILPTVGATTANARFPQFVRVDGLRLFTTARGTDPE